MIKAGLFLGGKIFNSSLGYCNKHNDWRAGGTCGGAARTLEPSVVWGMDRHVFG